MNMNTRFKQIRLSLGLTQPAMSESIGLSRNAWQSYELGKSIPGTGVYQSLIGLGFSTDWILSGFGSMRIGEAANGLDQYTFLPMLGSINSTDADRLACPGAVDWLAFKNEWLRLVLRSPPADLAIHLADSDSMQTTINVGDIMIVDHSRHSLRGDGIYVFKFGHSHITKRIHVHIDGSVDIISDNSIYPVQHMHSSDTESLIIAGRVIWFGKSVH